MDIATYECCICDPLVGGEDEYTVSFADNGSSALMADRDSGYAIWSVKVRIMASGIDARKSRITEHKVK
jgi:hypothetical protein